MTIVSSKQDPEALTLRHRGGVRRAAVERVWQVWEDPRQLERWWGPPTWPATFEQHEFVAGGGSRYYMTGPEGEKARGWWRFVSLDEPRHLEFEDGFSDESGVPNPQMPTIRGRRRAGGDRCGHPDDGHVAVRHPSSRWNSSSRWAWSRA